MSISQVKEKIVFASIAYPVESSERDAVLYAEGIRAHAGSLSQAPIWYFVPQIGNEFSEPVKERLDFLNVELFPFEVKTEGIRVPFTSQVIAKSLAESKAVGKTSLLSWGNTNGLIIQEPKHFILPDDKSLGYRPVHHILVGSRYREPLDAFWNLVFHVCDVPDERVFPMMTHIDNEEIRPYFNAGTLVTRPENQLFQKYRDMFFKVYQNPEFKEFYQKDERYAVFIHQAILSGVILSVIPTEELLELPNTYNYPLHLFEEDITVNRPSGLEELVSFRHEGFHKEADWYERIPANDSLKNWIAETLGRI